MVENLTMRHQQSPRFGDLFIESHSNCVGEKSRRRWWIFSLIFRQIDAHRIVNVYTWPLFFVVQPQAENYPPPPQLQEFFFFGGIVRMKSLFQNFRNQCFSSNHRTWKSKKNATMFFEQNFHPYSMFNKPCGKWLQQHTIIKITPQHSKKRAFHLLSRMRTQCVHAWYDFVCACNCMALPRKKKVHTKWMRSFIRSQ